MKFERGENCSGFLIGYIDVPYKKLVEVLGKCDTGDEYKIDAMWALVFEDGQYCHIYNYKNGKNYLGRTGTAVSNITNWHIGGNDTKVLENLRLIFPEHKITEF